jgi:hypothetical protein
MIKVSLIEKKKKGTTGKRDVLEISYILSQ